MLLSDLSSCGTLITTHLSFVQILRNNNDNPNPQIKDINIMMDRFSKRLDVSDIINLY
jgi:hypothetical protein